MFAIDKVRLALADSPIRGRTSGVAVRVSVVDDALADLPGAQHPSLDLIKQSDALAREGSISILLPESLS